MTAAPARRPRLTRFGWLVLTAGIVSALLFLGFSVGAGFVVFRVGSQFVAALEPARLAEQTPWVNAPFKKLWSAELTRAHGNEDRMPSIVMLWPSADRAREVWVAPAQADQPWARFALDGEPLLPVKGPREGRPVDVEGNGRIEFLTPYRGKDLVISDAQGKQRTTLSAPNEFEWARVVDFNEDGRPDVVVVGRESAEVMALDGTVLLNERFRVVADATVTQWDGRKGKELLVVSTGRQEGGTQARLGLGLVLTVLDETGQVVWEKRLDRFWYSKGVVCVVDANGQLTIAVAALESTIRGLTSVQLIGVDESGAVAWRFLLGRVGSYLHSVVPMATGRFGPGRGEQVATALDDGTLVILTPDGQEVARQAMGEHIRSLRRFSRPNQTDALAVELRDSVVVVALRS